VDTDIKPVEIACYFTDEVPRTPLKFGGVVMDRSKYCHVRAVVENRRGRRAAGWGAIFLSDVWAWPSAAVAHEQRESLMVELIRAWCRRVGEFDEFAHPIDVFWDLEPELVPLSNHLCDQRELPERMPRLGALVCASPIDAALHDAFGNVNNIDTYAGYGPDFMNFDLSRYLGQSFAGKYISDYIVPMPEWLDAFHLVGGLDKLTEVERTADDPDDNLPVSLEKWIEHEHLHCLKVKLVGNDLDWDLNRLLSVCRIARNVHQRLGIEGLWLTADTNEMCESPEYMVELLRRFEDQDVQGFDSLLYCEQPCERDLRRRHLDVHELAEIKPVIIDEALSSLEDLDLALELGYNGVALKTCKCQSAELVMAAKATKAGVLYSVQDLTNPGIALLQSAGLAGHLSVLKGVESNSRQFFPATNEPEQWVHPGIFRLTDGKMHLRTISGTGLGYQWDKIDRRFD